LRADTALRALADGGRAAGAEILEGCRVGSVDVGPRAVRVRTPEQAIDAAAVVIAAGAWGRGLLDPLGVDLAVVPTRETVSYFASPAEELPPVIDWSTVASSPDAARPGQAAYALPAPGIGLKAGIHHSGPVADPDDDGVPDATLGPAPWIERRFPAADPAPLARETCLYTNTADESFVLERHGRVVVGSACSGHGFKFAPTVGRTLAALARDAAR